jgi:hypothetical protein
MTILILKALCIVAVSLTGYFHYKKSGLQFDLIKNDPNTIEIVKYFISFNPFFVVKNSVSNDEMLLRQVRLYRNLTWLSFLMLIISFYFLID